MRLSRAMIVLAVVLSSAWTAQATPGHHAVTGIVQMDGGVWLRLDVSADVTPELYGRAWLGRDAVPAIAISIDCIDVTWNQPVYPIPPYLPFHSVLASGTGTDGVRYYITAYDTFPRPAGFGDYAAVSTEPAGGPCGADPELVVPVASGALTVLP